MVRYGNGLFINIRHENVYSNVKSSTFAHTQPLFSTLQIMNIYQINKYMSCILMFKHNKAMLPTLFNDVFVLSPMTHIYCTRQKFAYKIPFCRTKCRQLSLAYVEPKIWNTFILDNFLQHSATLQIFKKSVKYLLMKNQ